MRVCTCMCMRVCSRTTARLRSVRLTSRRGLIRPARLTNCERKQKASTAAQEELMLPNGENKKPKQCEWHAVMRYIFICVARCRRASGVYV